MNLTPQDSEARSFIASLVPALIERILDQLDSGAIQDPQKRSLRPLRPNGSSLRLLSGLVNRCNVVTEGTSPRVLIKIFFTFPGGILQIKGFLQKGNPSCGYYALHHGMLCVEAALFAFERCFFSFPEPPKSTVQMIL